MHKNPESGPVSKIRRAGESYDNHVVRVREFAMPSDDWMSDPRHKFGLKVWATDATARRGDLSIV